jgi:hypothetical protein
MKSIAVRVIWPVTLVAAFAGLAPAQWSSNPALNLAIRDVASDQNQPKVKPTSGGDGGCYISWMDGQASGWDMRLQRLDRAGSRPSARRRKAWMG